MIITYGHGIVNYTLSFPMRLYTVVSMVKKQAVPPITLDIGSARNTPCTPKPTAGRSRVRGTTIKAFLNSEKKMACFASPRA